MAEASETEKEEEVEEPPSKRSKTEGHGDPDPEGINAQLAELFGDDVEESGLERVLAEAEAALSDAESVPSFMVEEPRHEDEDAAFGIAQDKLDLVKDIFGDTSVLRPIGEIDVPEEETAPAAVHAGLGAAEAALQVSLPKQEADADLKLESGAATPVLPPLLPLLSDSLDPDILEKSYQLPKDQIFTASQLPERWLQSYCQRDPAEIRSWTDEEYQNEARWLFIQVFLTKGNTRVETEDAIILILTWLHEQRLEMLFIVEHLWWKVAKVLSKQDLWTIHEFDLMWQPLWARYLYLQQWVDNIESREGSQQLPDYIKKNTVREVWHHQDAEVYQRDVQEWLHSMHPAEAPSTGKAPGRNSTSVDAIMTMARKSKFDEKLGIAESIDIMSLQNFGITPAQLGDNLQAERQNNAPEEEKDNEASVDEICEAHVDPQFHSVQAVRDGVMTFLVRLIASEPRVRNFVRKEFWNLCAVSTKVTEAGRTMAKETSHSFKRMYRSFHVTNRPVSKFDENSDLFLEMLQLQRKGMVSIEYSLVQTTESNDDTQMKIVIPCCGRAEFGRKKQRFHAHFNSRDPQRAPTEPDDLVRWNESEALIPKLEAAAKLREAGFRRRGAQNDLKSQVTASFQCAGMRLSGDVIAEFMVHDPIYDKLCMMYCSTTVGYVLENGWNSVRGTILRRVLMEELYPMVWAEVQDHLVRRSSYVVCRDIRDRLTKMLDVRPPIETSEKLNEAEEKLNQMRQDSDDEATTQRRLQDPNWQREREARIRGLNSVLVVLPEVGLETCVVGFINAFGDPLDMRQVFKRCWRQQSQQYVHEKGSYGYDVNLKVQENRDAVMNMISMYKPAVILLAVTDPDILRLKVNVEDMINREQSILAQLKVLPKIKFVNATVPRAVAYHKRVMESPAYRDYPTAAHRIAISCARFFQDPLAEACQLWHELPDENGLFKIDLHQLQHDVPKEMLGRIITQTLQETFAKCGLCINKVRRSPHLEGLIQFVPGLGPRKARLFMKALTDSVKSRMPVVDTIAKQLGLQDTTTNPVIKNMYPFIKIQPDFRDAWQADESPSLDRIRIAPQLKNWVEALCREALSGQEQALFNEKDEDGEGDVLGRVLRVLAEDPNFLNVIQDQDWSRWPEQAGEVNFPDSANLDKLFETILNELIEPYKDYRQVEESELQGADLFYLALTEKAEEFKSGCVVRGSVLRDEEYPDHEMPDSGSKLHRVHVRLAGGNSSVRGTFQKEYRIKTSSTKAGHIAGCDRHFVYDEPILARVRDIKAGRMGFQVILSVDPDEEHWFDMYPIQADDVPYFLPAPHEDWTKVALGLLDNTEMQRKAKLKDWVLRPRNIKHPNYVGGDHEHAVKALNSFFIGTVLFRSSKHHDMLIAMLKVLPTQDREVANGTTVIEPPERCYRKFDVFEKRSTQSYGDGFEVSGELEVDGATYRDFDEIIARHTDPIMDNLRLLQEHKRFGLLNGTVTEYEKVEKALQHISRDNSLLHYSLLLNDSEPGQGALLWCIMGRRVKKETIEVTPRGFSLWNYHFERLDQLIAWFKRIGWRNCQKLRQDYKEQRKARAQSSTEKRGDHADPQARLKRHRGLGQANTTTLGLQTPGMRSAAGTVRPETAANTPFGMLSPSHSTPGSVGPGSSGTGAPGSRTSPGSIGGMQSPSAPTPSHAGTPVPPTRGVPATPAGVPSTPAACFQQGPTSRMPETPAGAANTPYAGTPGGYIPQTPAAAFGKPTPGVASTSGGTPSGNIPTTPLAAFSRPGRGKPSTSNIPQTPMEAFLTKPEAGGTPGNEIPQTPPAVFNRPAPSGVKRDE